MVSTVSSCHPPSTVTWFSIPTQFAIFSPSLVLFHALTRWQQALYCWWPRFWSCTLFTARGSPQRPTPAPPSCSQPELAMAAASSLTISERPTTGWGTTLQRYRNLLFNPPAAATNSNDFFMHLSDRIVINCLNLTGFQGHVVVGLWVPNNSHGQQNDIGRQQYME